MVLTTLCSTPMMALAVKDFMLSRRRWEDTPAKFKEELEKNRFNEDKHRPKGWPTTASAMSSRLRRAATSLRRAGIEVEFSRAGKRRNRKITIRSVPRAEDEHSDNGLNSSSAPSASPDGSKNRYDGNDFQADTDFDRPSSARHPPSSAEGDKADNDKARTVRPNLLKSNGGGRADEADDDFGPISVTQRSAPRATSSPISGDAMTAHKQATEQ